MATIQTCKQCQTTFEITAEDLQFYAKISPVFGGKKYEIPPPTLCPDCRCQRRLAFRNERKLYHRKCDMCHQQIISIYASDKSLKVYCQKCWYSDKWDALAYGREFNFSISFFEQFKKLMEEVPILSLNLQKDNENCEYTNLTSLNKNCYMIFAAAANENCFYSTYLQRSRNIIDGFFIFDSESCYECVDCYNCYQVFFSQNCQNCNDSFFLYDCKSCENCFCCVSLMNKKYFIFNEPCSENEYRKKIAEIFSDPKKLADAKEKFHGLKRKTFHKYYSGFHNDLFSGDYITNSKNTFYSYDCSYLEDCKYSTWLHKSKDCYDCYAWGLSGELGYENHLCGNNFYNVKFSDSCWNDVSDLSYCHYCINNSQNLFGCISLHYKKYCILNKQYTKEEYESLVPRIIEHMKKTGEWGEFFPMSLSPFGYNETVAQEYYPLAKSEAIACGAKWKEEELKNVYTGPKIKIPDQIEAVTDQIVQQILICEHCDKNYKIIKQELEFYRKMKLPVPKKCPDCRHKERMMLRNPRKLYDRKCAKCGVEIKTTYAPDRPEIVYCENCYLKEVY